MNIFTPTFRIILDDYNLNIRIGSLVFSTINSISVDDLTIYGNTTITIGKYQLHIKSQEYVSIFQIVNINREGLYNGTIT